MSYNLSAAAAESIPATPPERPLWIMLLVATSMFMEMLDSTVIVTALPKMADTFHTTAINLSLGITAYMLSTAALLPASGWIADRYGTRSTFAFATAIFTLSSIWCGMAHGVIEFVIARSLQGLGAALMSPVGRLVVLRATPKQQLVHILNLLTIPALVGPVLGPPLGGLITTYASWRWCFLINVPIGMGILIGAYKLIPNLRGAKQTFDVIGFIFNGVGLAAIIYGMSRLTEHWPGDARSYGLIALGIVFAYLALRHARRAPRPLLNMAAFKIKTFWVSNVSGGAAFRLSMAAPLFVLPLMLQLGLGLTAFQAGLLILTHSGGDLVTKATTNLTMNRFGFRRVLLWTAIVFAGTMGACGLVTSNTSFWLLSVVLFAAGAARSLHMAALNSLQFADIGIAELSHASTLSSIAMQVQRAVGVSLGAVLLNFAVSMRTDAVNSTLTQADFRTAFFAMGALTLSSLLWYSRLSVDSGKHLLTPND